MSGAASLVDLDQQIISNTKYWRQTDPEVLGIRVDYNTI